MVDKEKKQILSSLSTANVYRLSRVKVSGTCVQPFKRVLGCLGVLGCFGVLGCLGILGCFWTFGCFWVWGVLGFRVFGGFGCLEVLWYLGVLGCLGVTVKRLRV